MYCTILSNIILSDQDALNFVISEFTSSEVHVPGRNTSSSSGRPVSWSGIRYMISQVYIYIYMYII